MTLLAIIIVWVLLSALAVYFNYKFWTIFPDLESNEGKTEDKAVSASK